jgi:hypothetical protein
VWNEKRGGGDFIAGSDGREGARVPRGHGTDDVAGRSRSLRRPSLPRNFFRKAAADINNNEVTPFAAVAGFLVGGRWTPSSRR